jgi:hypothetical protein
LGKLIFNVHKLSYPRDADQDDKSTYLDMRSNWTCINKDPTADEIKELKEFLVHVQGRHWKVVPYDIFQNLLNEMKEPTAYQDMTAPTATGSPLK